MVLGLDPLIKELLTSTRSAVTESILHVVNSQDGEREAISLIPNSELQGRVDVALLLVATDVEELLTGAVVGQAVDQPRVGVECKDDGPVVCEERGVLSVCQAVRMVSVGDEFEQVDHVDEANLDVGEVLAQQRSCGERFLGHHIAARGHDHVGLSAVVVGSPIPDTNALGAVCDGIFHAQELKVVLLVSYYDVDVVCRAEAVVHGAQQAVGIRRQVNADNLGRLVHNDGEEARILVSETIVI